MERRAGVPVLFRLLRFSHFVRRRLHARLIANCLWREAGAAGRVVGLAKSPSMLLSGQA
jgi:hypothetical protein